MGFGPEMTEAGGCWSTVCLPKPVWIEMFDTRTVGLANVPWMECGCTWNILSSVQLQLVKVKYHFVIPIGNDVGLTEEMLKHAPAELCEQLLSVHNDIVCHGTVPQSWCCTLVNMLPKKVRPTQATDFRPAVAEILLSLPHF